MLYLDRSVARQLHVVFRKAGFRSQTNKSDTVYFAAGDDGCRIRAARDRVMVEYRLNGSFDPTSFNVPISVLAEAGARKPDQIRFDLDDPQQVVASWLDARVPKRQVVTIKTDDPPNFLATPQTLTANPPGLLQALADATAVAARDSTRYAINCLRLSGSRGSIAATDGGQLLVQNGFQFPWQEDLVIPASGVFNAAELPCDQPVQVARAGDWVLFATGSWTIWLQIEKEARFPRVEDLIHSPDYATATLTLPDDDVQFLNESLPQLPTDDANHNPVTLDLNGHVALRARPADQETATELILSRSRYDGLPICVNMNRDFLRRAIKLGFRTVSLFGPEAPVQCRDEHRTYLWAMLAKDGIVPAAANTVRIESLSSTTSPTSASPPLPSSPRNRLPMIASAPTTQPTTKVVEPIAKPSSSPIEQAISVRNTLRSLLNDTNALIAALKRQKQQSRLVQSTLQSLRQLQVVS